jgi:quercetin dioxygenase-like cupin family protein
MTLASQAALPTEMTVIRAGGAIFRIPDGVASAPFWIEPLLASTRDGELTALRATFGPAVVSHWHSHPLGQILLVISGVGQVQRDGGVVTEVRAGDCIWFAPGERHWRGATRDSIFSYVGIQALDQGTAVHWLGPVENPD